MTGVFVVDRAAFFDGDWPQGFWPVAPEQATAWLDRAAAAGRFVVRAAAERNPAWKQWIPYCVLRCGTGLPADAGVFAVQRTRGQSEARLHGAWSIGLGGHVEDVDAGDRGSGSRLFGGALARELAEELDLRRIDLPLPQFLGVLNDDGTEVGQVHAGLVYVVDLPLPYHEANRRMGIREISKMRGGFASLVEFADLWQNPAQFESWSRLLIRAGIADPIGGCRAKT